MTNDNLRCTASEYDEPPVIPAEFQPAMQSVLATLADLDFAHQREVDQISRSGVDDVFKARLIAKLDQLHRERRHPYAQELFRLQERMRSLFRREPV
jgi:streptomycin 6-kinase